MKSIVQFIKYNNFFTLAILFIFLGSGVTLAANENVRDGVISKTEKVRSLDNSYVLSADIENHNFNLRIAGIAEDADFYYVDYSYSTIVVEDYVWRDKIIQKKLNVAKKSLDGKDLGLFVSEQLRQTLNQEFAYLKDVKNIESRKGATQKVASVQYGGLVGRMFNPREKVFAGYNPVIPPVKTERPEGPQIAAVAGGKLSQSIPKSNLIPKPEEQKPEEQKPEAEQPQEEPVEEPAEDPIKEMVDEILNPDKDPVIPPVATSKPPVIVPPEEVTDSTGSPQATTTPPVVIPEPDTASTTPDVVTPEPPAVTEPEPVVVPEPEAPQPEPEVQ